VSSISEDAGRFHGEEGEREPARGIEDNDEDEQDVALMLRAKGGDIEAFEKLVKRHQHSVVGTAARMLGSPAEAEDIGQQVFVRVWKSAARYEPTAKFTTWLMTITRNLVFNELRRRRRAHLISMDQVEDDVAPHQLADADVSGPSKKLLEAEMQEAIDAAIASLPEKQRLAIVLRRYEGMPYDEIAKVLNTSVEALKSILFRARAGLRQTLSKYLE
jgi:RNA polymerase sigma factor (sigma-70 family)